MPRTDDDSWDITESVGATALGDAADWLSAHGWRASVQTAGEPIARCGRHVPALVEDARHRTLFVTAQR